MFTNLKIESDKLPWSYLSIQDKLDQATWRDNQDKVPGNFPHNGIGTSDDIKNLFNDTYVDLCQEMEHLSELSQLADRTPVDYLY